MNDECDKQRIEYLWKMSAHNRQLISIQDHLEILCANRPRSLLKLCINYVLNAFDLDDLHKVLPQELINKLDDLVL